MLRPQCCRKNWWSYAQRYCVLSCDPAFEETESADQGHVGIVVCSAYMTFKMDQEEDPGNVIGTVEIQDELGTFETDLQSTKL